MTTTELIFKGTILGLALFFTARAIYAHGYWHGFKKAIDEIKRMAEEKEK